MKYKIGDKVRIKNLKYGMYKYRIYFTDDMVELCGKYATIEDISEIMDACCIDLDNGDNFWIDEFFEDEPITIYGLGTKVNHQYKLENGSHVVSDENGVYNVNGMQMNRGAYILYNGDVLVVTEDGKKESILTK